MSEGPPQGRERRAYTRYNVAVPIEFRSVDGDAPGISLQGTTINLSRGGVLIDLGISAAAESACVVTFIEAGDAIEPTAVCGHVVHTGLWKNGRDAVAVQFDTPLAILELPDAV